MAAAFTDLRPSATLGTVSPTGRKVQSIVGYAGTAPKERAMRCHSQRCSARAYLTFCVWGHTMSDGGRYDREEEQARSHGRADEGVPRPGGLPGAVCSAEEGGGRASSERRAQRASGL